MARPAAPAPTDQDVVRVRRHRIKYFPIRRRAAGNRRRGCGAALPSTHEEAPRALLPRCPRHIRRRCDARRRNGRCGGRQRNKIELACVQGRRGCRTRRVSEIGRPRLSGRGPERKRLLPPVEGYRATVDRLGALEAAREALADPGNHPHARFVVGQRPEHLRDLPDCGQLVVHPVEQRGNGRVRFRASAPSSRPPGHLRLGRPRVERVGVRAVRQQGRVRPAGVAPHDQRLAVFEPPDDLGPMASAFWANRRKVRGRLSVRTIVHHNVMSKSQPTCQRGRRAKSLRISCLDQTYNP